MSDKKQFAVVMLVSALFVAWILYSSLGIVFINNELKDDSELGQYPFQFRVLRAEGRVAVMSTLRSPELPAIVALRVLFPELRDLSSDNPRVQKAERQMARMQARAQQIVLTHPEFDFVRWELDENWLRLNGIRKEAYSQTRLSNR